MFKFLKKNSVNSLQEKYEKLQKEAYDLSKIDPKEHEKKQVQANEVLKQIAQQKYQ